MAQSAQRTEDQMLELTERARSISQQAGTRVTSAMRDMLSAAAGIAGFAVESARDLVQYMVRRGQMTQEEADKLIREAEAVHNKKPKAERERIAATKAAAEKAAAEKKAARLAMETALPANKPLSKTVKTPPPLAKGQSMPSSESLKIEKEKPAPTLKAIRDAKASGKSAAPAKAAAKSAPAKKAAPAKAPAKKAVKKKK